MAKSLAAVEYGNDYQKLVFWHYANKMLRDDSEIEFIGYEYPEMQSFDDIAVKYRVEQKFRDGFIDMDYIQVKYHVNQNRKFTLEDLCNPSFVNAKEYSFLNKAVKAYKDDKNKYLKSRFILYTPWDIDQTDFLYQLVSNNDGSLALDKLFDRTKTDKSNAGTQRKLLRDELSLPDTELKEVLSRICIYNNKDGFDALLERVNEGLRYNGLIESPQSKQGNPYLSMVSGFLKSNIYQFNKKTLLDYCSKEDLIRKEESLAEVNSLQKDLMKKSDIDEFDSSTPFFSYRIGKAFPGIRGMQEFDDSEVCIERLNVLLKNPLSSKILYDPIWCFRGGSSLLVKSYRSFPNGKFFINNDEYVIKKLVVYRSSSYYKDFLYVETKPEKSIGVYGEYDYKKIADEKGHFVEEYGLYKGNPIKKQEYYDGAAIIDGKLVEFDEMPILRNRYLTAYNFIICAKYHAFNSSKCDRETKPILEGILSGTNDPKDLIEYCESLERHEMDF